MHPKAIFSSGTIYLFISLTIMFKLLKREGLNVVIGITTILFFLPTLFFARSLMSEMPSLLIMAAYCWVVFKIELKYTDYIFLGLLAGLSLWFRQTTIVLCVALVLIPCIRNWKNGVMFLIALIIGSIPKFVSSLHVYGDMFYSKNYEPFGVINAINNLTIYGFVTLALLPGGLILAYFYKGRKSYGVILSVFTFFLLHLFYQYNAKTYSGFMSAIFYNGRYFIPCLPLFAIIYAWHAKRIVAFRFNTILPWAAICILWIITFSFIHNKVGQGHKEVGVEFFNSLQENDVILYSESSYRYLNPSIEKMRNVIPMKKMEELDISGIENDIVYLHASKANTNRQQRYSKKLLNRLKLKFVDYNINAVNEFEIFDNTNITIYRMARITNK